jgi:chromate reductase, NAD(P)H dehydrogenase (quinone)
LHVAVHILAICGSLNGNSANTRLLRRLATVCSAFDVEVWEGLGELPYFSPDAAANESVDRLRERIAEADAVCIATPEYAGGMPGSLKNALDWLVGSGELYGKRLVVISAAPSSQRGHNARRWVEQVARMQGADVVGSFTVAVPPGADQSVLEVAVEDTAARLQRCFMKETHVLVHP